MFIDWLKVSQEHDSDLPMVGDTLRITIDKASGDVLHTSEPRYKIEGSYSTSVHIVIQGRKVTVDGNPSRINRQDNLFGFKTIQECLNVYNSLLAEYGIPPFTKCTERYIKDGKSGARAGDWSSNGATIERLDLTTNVSVGQHNVRDYLRGLSMQRVGHSIGRLFPNGWSVDWTTSGAGTGARLQYRKAYSKAEEIRSKLLPRLKRQFGEHSEELAYATKLHDWCNEVGLVRFEQELKSEYLKREQLAFWGLFTESRLLELHAEFIKTDERLKVNSMDLAGITEQLILEHVVDNPKAARTTAMYAIEWMQGVKHDRTKRAFETHAARLNKIGINIRNACDTNNVVTVFVRQIREVNPIKELDMPTWYIAPKAPSHFEAGSVKTFSSQGLQLSAGQKRRQQFEKQASVAFLNPILAQQTAEAIAAAAKVERKPLPKQWTFVNTTRGTPCLSDVFGFGGYEGKQETVLGTWDKYGNFYPDTI